MQQPNNITYYEDSAILTYTAVDRVSSLSTFAALTANGSVLIDNPGVISSNAALSIPPSLQSEFRISEITLDFTAQLLIFDGVSNTYQLYCELIACGNLTGTAGIRVDDILIQNTISRSVNSIYIPYIIRNLDLSEFSAIVGILPDYNPTSFPVAPGANHRLQIVVQPQIILRK